jgi:hypothetical protein
MSPLANSFLTFSQLSQAEAVYPLHAYVCHECFLVQLDTIANPEEIFSEYAYFSSYSDSWLEHARSYVDAVISRFHITPDNQVIEIASNDGYLLQRFVEKGIPVLGIEPARNTAQAAIAKGIPTLVRFFGEQTARDLRAHGPADLIIANNVLAHVPNLSGFVRGLQLLLADDGVVTLEFPHLLRLIEDNQFDTIYHEHFSYFSLTSAEQLFRRHGMRVFDVEELSTHGGSLRIYVTHESDSSHPVEDRLSELLERERQAGLATLGRYLEFAPRLEATKRAFVDFLRGAKADSKSVAAYGAPAKGNTLLTYCRIGKDLIQYTVDRNPHKQGRFLPGTRIPIYSPEHIAMTKPDYVVILPWNLRNEIMEQMRHIREWGGKFVVPIPQVNVL